MEERQLQWAEALRRHEVTKEMLMHGLPVRWGLKTSAMNALHPLWIHAVRFFKLFSTMPWETPQERKLHHFRLVSQYTMIARLARIHRVAMPREIAWFMDRHQMTWNALCFLFDNVLWSHISQFQKTVSTLQHPTQRDTLLLGAQYKVIENMCRRVSTPVPSSIVACMQAIRSQ